MNSSGGGGGGKRSRSNSPLPNSDGPFKSPYPGRQGEPVGTDGTLGAKKTRGSISGGTSPKFQHPQPGMQGQPIGKDGTLGQKNRSDGMDNIFARSAVGRGMTLVFQGNYKEEIMEAFQEFDWGEVTALGGQIDSLEKLLKEVDVLSKYGADSTLVADVEEEGDEVSNHISVLFVYVHLS